MKKILSVVLVVILMLSVAGCECKHKYTDATCTSPQTCTKCGETFGEPLTHSYSFATCTSPQTCTKCGGTTGRPLAHNYAYATCTSPKKCYRCGETDGTSLGHWWGEATCSAPKTCARCGITEGTPKGHNYVGGYCTRCFTTDPNSFDTKNNDILTIEQMNFEINSAGGVEVDIKFTNRSNKQIAYVYFTIKFYDRMGRPASCEIKNTHTQRLKMTGPVNAGASKTSYWSAIIYNSTTAVVRPLSAEIEYTDGTKQTISFRRWYWHDDSYYGGELKD